MSQVPDAFSIFQQPWWLDAVAPSSWGEITLTDNEAVIGRLPYVIKKRWGLTILSQPILTPTLGPWLRSSRGKYAARLKIEKELYSQLIEGLPKFDLFQQTMSPLVTNVLPFYWAGFSAETRVTYQIEDLNDLDVVWNAFEQRLRTQTRKAAKQLTVRTDLNLDTFLDLSLKSFRRRGTVPGYSDELVRRIDHACAIRDARRVFFAVDAQGNVHAAEYLVWDENAAYCLMGGMDDRFTGSGGPSLVMWEAIKFASTVTNVFDFTGSMMEGVERFLRSFGARQVPYFLIRKASRRMRILLSLKELSEALTPSRSHRAEESHLVP